MFDLLLRERRRQILRDEDSSASSGNDLSEFFWWPSSPVAEFSSSLRNLGSAWVPLPPVDVVRSREFDPPNDIPIWTSLEFSLADVSPLLFALPLCAASDLESSL